MRNRIKFVTTNSGKFEEAVQWLQELEPKIVLEQAALDIPEIQSLNAVSVGIHKAVIAWQTLQEPLLIDDGGIYLNRYHMFPGPLSKYVYQGLGPEGFWLLAHQDPRAYFLNVLVYKDNDDSQEIFQGTCEGTIKNPAHVSGGHAQLPFTRILVPHGTTKTLAEMRGTEEEKQYHHRYHALQQFVQWLKNHRK